MTEVEVEIYGKKYTLRGLDPEQIRAVAKYVDRRLRELFGPEPKPLDPSKTFALALNFAEELHNLQQESRAEEAEISEKLESLAKKLERLEKIVEM